MASRRNADLIQRKTTVSSSSPSSDRIIMSPNLVAITDQNNNNIKTKNVSSTSVPPPPPSPRSSSSSNHLLARTTRFFEHRARVRIKLQQQQQNNNNDSQSDAWNYALLIALYTLQGIPIGLSASIPFLIQQKMKMITHVAASAAVDSAVAGAALATTTISAERLTYRANAIFALCSWPFSLKLLWAPIVDSCFIRSFGRRKSWFVPVQALAGMLMLTGSNFVERQLGLGNSNNNNILASSSSNNINVKGITAYFFALYFLFATQDIAVDGYALTLLSKKNRGRGPVCNSIGQNIGYFISFVGFLALNDVESCETIWRPLFRLPSNPNAGLVTLGGFLRVMGIFTLVTTTLVAIFKKETMPVTTANSRERKSGGVSYERLVVGKNEEDTTAATDKELDAAEIGLKETYHRLWAVCQLPSVRWLFFILLTYRLPTSLGDNVKLLKSVEYGLSKTTTALLSPTIILPLGILVPIIATRIWHDTPLHQFMTAYKLRVTLVPILDVIMLQALRRGKPHSASGLIAFWTIIVMSTALQAAVNSLQFNAQMSFFAKRVDPAIGGSYMTLLNTAANLGGTWPASLVMWLVGVLSKGPTCTIDTVTGIETCVPGRDPYFAIQAVWSALGCLWILLLGRRVKILSVLPDDAWRTHLLDKPEYDEEALLSSMDVELAESSKEGKHN